MHQVLINNYNASVPESGVCYFLGDFGMGPSDKTKEFLSKLNGTKVLIRGNHEKGFNSMYNLGFDVVLNEAAIHVSGERVTLTHCPLRGVLREDVTGMRGTVSGDLWHGEHKNQEYSVDDTGQFALHGHVHKKPNERTLGRQFDVGVVANDFRPVSLSQIESWIAKTKRDEK